MTLNFFSKPTGGTNGKRHDAVLTVRIWLSGRTHLPRDLVAALHQLIPDLGKSSVDDTDGA